MSLECRQPCLAWIREAKLRSETERSTFEMALGRCRSLIGEQFFKEFGLKNPLGPSFHLLEILTSQDGLTLRVGELEASEFQDLKSISAFPFASPSFFPWESYLRAKSL